MKSMFPTSPTIWLHGESIPNPTMHSTSVIDAQVNTEYDSIAVSELPIVCQIMENLAYSVMWRIEAVLIMLRTHISL
jgi:hypothetical protein